MIELQNAYTKIERELQLEVLNLIAQFGVPQSVGAAYELADLLYPLIVELRTDIYRREFEALVNAHGMLEMPAQSFYPATACRKMVANCAGLGPFSANVAVEMFDPKSQAVAKMSLAPYLNPDVEDVQLAMINRVGGAASRHVKQESRDLVRRTADLNGMRWARRLSGAENCPFCAMLASRGAVYSSEHEAGGADGRKYHDHCDCTAELVPDLKNWEGKQQADELYHMWQKSGGNMSGFSKAFKEQGAFSGVSNA